MSGDLLDGLTHYVPDRGGFLAFALDHCERCGVGAVGPEQIRILEPEEVLMSLGLGLLPVAQGAEAPRLGWCDDFGGGVCPACYGQGREEEGPAPEPETLTFTQRVVLTEDHLCFLSLLLGSAPGGAKGKAHVGDVLIRCFSGYWLCGVEHNPDDLHGWLCYESSDDGGAAPGDDLCRRALSAFRRWTASPRGARPVTFRWEGPDGTFHFLDRALALRVLEWGLVRHGGAFVDGTCDYSDYDTALQSVLLGEVVYG